MSGGLRNINRRAEASLEPVFDDESLVALPAKHTQASVSLRPER